MRVTIFEGTVEEILQAFPHLRENGQAATVPNGEAELPEDVQEILALSRPADRPAVDQYVAEVLSWEGVQIAAGHRRRGGLTRYVRFYRRNGAQGAFAYLFPGRSYVQPRLPAAELADARFGRARTGRAGTGMFSQSLALTPREAWDEAVGFTRRAYDGSAA